MLRKIKQNYIVLILIFLSVLTILILQNFGFKSYSRYSTDTLHYDKGVVVEISNEDIEYDKELKIHLGSQDLKIKMSEGIQKGKIIERKHIMFMRKSICLLLSISISLIILSHIILYTIMTAHFLFLHVPPFLQPRSFVSAEERD